MEASPLPALGFHLTKRHALGPFKDMGTPGKEGLLAPAQNLETGHSPPLLSEWG